MSEYDRFCSIIGRLLLQYDAPAYARWDQSLQRWVLHPNERREGKDDADDSDDEIPF